MAKVTVRPSGLEFEAVPGTSIMACAEGAGLSWPTTCHGIGECRTCVMYVLDDLGAVSSPSAFETEALATVSFSLRGEPERWRMACQAEALADVTVRKPGVVAAP